MEFVDELAEALWADEIEPSLKLGGALGGGGDGCGTAVRGRSIDASADLSRMLMCVVLAPLIPVRYSVSPLPTPPYPRAIVSLTLSYPGAYE